MSFWISIRGAMERNPIMREMKFRFGRYLHAAKFYLKGTPGERNNAARGHLSVLACPDNDFIPRVADAGKIIGGSLIMYNGVKTVPCGYYGYANMKMLQNARGVHEPQEERVFLEVIKTLPPKSTMIELGAFWAFYSLCFAHDVKEARCFMVEPILTNMNYGKKNFSLNGYQGNFTQAFVGDSAGTIEGIPRICIDDFVVAKGIDKLDILHSDIQGFELDMLRGAEKTILAGKIHYIFISTHSNELHERCREFLEQHDYLILASADLNDSYGPDGVLVGRLKSMPGLDPVAISHRSQAVTA